MKSKITFKEHNFCLYDFYSLYKKCEPILITDLHNYGLLNKKFCKDVKVLVMHHVILQLCNTVLESKGKEKNVVYFYDRLPADLKITEYYDSHKIQQIFCSVIKKLSTYLPIRFFISNQSFSDIIECSSGAKSELIAKVTHLIESYDITRYSFSKIYSFTKRYDLKFLNKEYFNTIKARQLLIA